MRILGVLAVLASTAAIAACGDDGGRSSASVGASIAVPVAERLAPVGETSIAGQAITDFGVDLFAEVRSADSSANVTISPASIAIALAMVEPGTSDDARTQMRDVLHIDDPDAFHASMNALEQDLEARAPREFGEDDDPGEVTLHIANAAYLQEGYPFMDSYLDAVGANYGPILREVDFAPDPDAVAHEINDFVADATNDQIVDLLADGVVSPDTVLALVNALYLKASWLQTFDEAATTEESFTLLDNRTVIVDAMNGRSSSSAAGDGWVGATKSYVGGLSAQFILPDEDRFDEIAGGLSEVFQEFEANVTSGDDFTMPRFETRTSTELSDVLKGVGLVAPFHAGGLLGIAGDGRLQIDQVVHEAFVAMNEEGTEAAAATVVLSFPTSGPPLPPVPVILDRPFFYRIIDDTSGATLFIGQITDPTA